MDTFFKQHASTVKLSGLNETLDFTADRVDNDIESAYRKLEQEEELKRKERNKRFDPFFMESDLPEQPDTGNVSLNPNDMIFDF